MTTNHFEKIFASVSKIKHENPLVLNITNDVTMDFIANGLLSIGASPIISKAEQEIEDLLRHVKSVVINLGTLNKEFIALCKRTCEMANEFNIPIVLDPVGAGASTYRTETCLSLLNDYHISVIRGNASEVMSLQDTSQQTKGVDSLATSNDAIKSGIQLSKKYHAAIIISGKIDIVIDDDLLIQHDCGSALMPSITGTGCLLTAVIGAFVATEKNRFEAAHLGTLFYGTCGEIAAKNAKGPGSFRLEFLDALHALPERGHYEKN